MKTLALVEPNEIERQHFKSMLDPTPRGWKLNCYTDAAEVLAACGEEAPDMVISASGLPDRGGIELLEELQTRHPETIRFLLVDEVESHHFKGLMSAAQQLVVKPLDMTEFIRRMERAFSLRSVIHNPAILKLLGGAAALPSLPSVFQRLTFKLNDPNASLGEIAEIVAEDVALSAKVLQLTNSALFGLRTRARDIGHAVSLLGGRAISSLVLSQSMADAFDCGPGNERFVEELNRHSIECGTNAAKILTKWKAKRALVEQGVFSGIVHEMGKLVLAKHAPDQWPEVMERIKEGIRPDVQIERQAFGVSHCEIAAYLLALWGFSDEQVSVVAFHHEPSKFRYNDSPLLRAMHLAENSSPTSLHGQELDWDYLKEWNINEKGVKKMRKLIAAA